MPGPRQPTQPSRPRCLILAAFAGSVVSFRGHLIADLAAAGYEVHVAAPGLEVGGKPREEILALGAVPHGIALRRTGTNPIADMLYAMRVFRFSRSLRPELVLAYTVKPIVYGLPAARIAGARRTFALVTGLGYAFTAGGRTLLGRAVRVLYRAALSKVYKVFFQNPDDLALFRAEGLLGPATPAIVVNGSGLDVEAFPVTPLPGGAPVFLLIGRLLGDKGVRDFAEAARRVKALRPEVRFHVVGWIDSNPNAIARSELDAWVADGNLEFLGKLDDVRPAIAASTVYVLPSYREGTPRTVLEAMAMGRPIITTDAPGCRETVIEGDNGFLVPVQSVDALVDAMLKFIEDPALAPRMGRRSRQIAEDKYDVHKVNAVMLREMGITPAADATAGAA